MTTDNNEKKLSTTKKVMAWAVAGIATAAVCVLLFSVAGAAVFFLPMIGGAFAKS